MTAPGVRDLAAGPRGALQPPTPAWLQHNASRPAAAPEVRAAQGMWCCPAVWPGAVSCPKGEIGNEQHEPARSGPPGGPECCIAVRARGAGTTGPQDRLLYGE